MSERKARVGGESLAEKVLRFRTITQTQGFDALEVEAERLRIRGECGTRRRGLGRRRLISSSYLREIIVIDRETEEVIGTIPLDAFPTGLAGGLVPTKP